MAYTNFTNEQVEEMRTNPHTRSLNEKQIRFTLDFKEKFIKLLISGKSLRSIFQELGYDPDVIGHDRMCNISSRIQKEAKSPNGLHEGNKKHFSKPSGPNYENMPPDQAMARMQHEILYMRQELEFIKKIIKSDKSD